MTIRNMKIVMCRRKKIFNLKSGRLPYVIKQPRLYVGPSQLDAQVRNHNTCNVIEE